MPALTPVAQKFILHWGEMGTRWGINRTVAQVHALLFLSPVPLHAEEISKTLSVARSNVSNSLRELQGWRIVRVVHVLGDRRDHFETFKDVWEIFRTVSEERKRREIDPTLPGRRLYAPAPGNHARVPACHERPLRRGSAHAPGRGEGTRENAWPNTRNDAQDSWQVVKRNGPAPVFCGHDFSLL